MTQYSCPYISSFVSERRRSNSSRVVRVRVRPAVIRVRTCETAFRAVVRVAATQPQLLILCLPCHELGQGVFYDSGGELIPHTLMENVNFLLICENLF